MRSRKPTTTEKALFALVVCSILGLGGVVGTQHLDGMRDRLRTLEARMAEAPRRTREVEGELERVRAELGDMQSELESARDDAEGSRLLAERLVGAEARLRNIAGTIEAHQTSLTELEHQRSRFGPETLEARFAERDEAIASRWESLNLQIDSAARAAGDSQARLDDLRASLDRGRDVLSMWDELIGPTVMLAGENSVGSGVLFNAPHLVDEAGGEPVSDTYVLTAWHVVRDIVEGDLALPVPVTIYRRDGEVDDHTAELLHHDAVIDAALLRLDSSQPARCSAILAARARLDNIRIFDRVYAVGCPLGNDPIPTPGEISTYSHVVDGITYWMINAPTYIGNSGGGIFDAETHELLGIFSKIYTHGSLRPTIVPHMGLVTPLATIYDWLVEIGYGDLVPGSAAVGTELAASAVK